MGFVSILSYTQQLIASRVRSGDHVIDATMGNGVDTLFLFELVGGRGSVHAFDIQTEAIANTMHRFETTGAMPSNVTLHLHSHSEMEHIVPQKLHGSITAVMFNFGYLPGASNDVITQAETSIQALEAAQRLLKPGGLITSVLYPGHEGGEAEAQAIEAWAQHLPQSEWKVLCYRFINIHTKPPYLLAIEKLQAH